MSGTQHTKFEITFDEVLDISNAGALHAELSAALLDHDEIALCGEAVERIDGAAMQVLTAAHLTAGERKKTLVWESVSDALNQAAARLGLTQVLNLDSNNDSSKQIGQADPPITAT